MSAEPEAAAVPLLQLDDVSSGYGPFRALFHVSFALAPGKVLALLGSNGSGKTTVARVCSGLLPPTMGKVWFDGIDVTDWRPYRFARLGIVHAPEGRSVFASLTVEEAYSLFPRLGERRRQIAGTLSGGEQRMLSLARVLVEQPRLLIADELSLGLAPIIVDEVYKTLERIRDAGTTLLLVEQHVQHALGIADDAIVMVKGEVAYSGPVSELGDVHTRVLGEGGNTDK
jgi:branched-chain amino acid transport system ATP-binding protein